MVGARSMSPRIRGPLRPGLAALGTWSCLWRLELLSGGDGAVDGRPGYIWRRWQSIGACKGHLVQWQRKEGRANWTSIPAKWGQQTLETLRTTVSANEHCKGSLILWLARLTAFQNYQIHFGRALGAYATLGPWICSPSPGTRAVGRPGMAFPLVSFLTSDTGRRNGKSHLLFLSPWSFPPWLTM